MTLFADPETFGLEHVGSLWGVDQQRLQAIGLVVFHERASGRLLYARGESDQDLWSITERVGLEERQLEGFHTVDDLIVLTPLHFEEFAEIVEEIWRTSQGRATPMQTVTGAMQQSQDERATCKRFLAIVQERMPKPTSKDIDTARRRLVALRRSVEKSPQARR